MGEEALLADYDDFLLDSIVTALPRAWVIHSYESRHDDEGKIHVEVEIGPVPEEKAS